jgi:hypothetical protein
MAIGWNRKFTMRHLNGTSTEDGRLQLEKNDAAWPQTFTFQRAIRVYLAHEAFMIQIETIHWHTLAPQFLNPSSRVLDLGANYGHFAYAITERCGCQ